MEVNPKDIAPAKHRPSAADLPRPRGAVNDTVVDLPLYNADASGDDDDDEEEDFFLSRSAHASRNVNTARA